MLTSSRPAQFASTVVCSPSHDRCCSSEMVRSRCSQGWRIRQCEVSAKPLATWSGYDSHPTRVLRALQLSTTSGQHGAMIHPPDPLSLLTSYLDPNAWDEPVCGVGSSSRPNNSDPTVSRRACSPSVDHQPHVLLRGRRRIRRQSCLPLADVLRLAMPGPHDFRPRRLRLALGSP